MDSKKPIPVQYVRLSRHVKAEENRLRQAYIYAPCGCGSGKKFKFCCHAEGLIHANAGLDGRRTMETDNGK